MKQLTPEQIQENYLKLREIINNTFEGERLEKLNKMYDYFEDRMSVAPASAKEHYHNAMVGGYVDHILNIVEFSQQVRDIWEQNGAEINFTNEELNEPFSAKSKSNLSEFSIIVCPLLSKSFNFALSIVCSEILINSLLTNIS